MLESLARYVSEDSTRDATRAERRIQSTVLKQMKLIHNGGYNDAERESYKEIIFSNTLQSMRYVHVSFRPVPAFKLWLLLQCYSGGDAGT